MTCPGSCSPDAGSSQHPFQTCQAVPGLYKLSSISSIPEIPSLEADPEHPFEKGVFLATRLFQQTLPGHLVLLIVTTKLGLSHKLPYPPSFSSWPEKSLGSASEPTIGSKLCLSLDKTPPWLWVGGRKQTGSALTQNGHGRCSFISRPTTTLWLVAFFVTYAPKSLSLQLGQCS